MAKGDRTPFGVTALRAGTVTRRLTRSNLAASGAFDAAPRTPHATFRQPDATILRLQPNRNTAAGVDAPDHAAQLMHSMECEPHGQFARSQTEWTLSLPSPSMTC
jgi:hypothetical protein